MKCTRCGRTLQEQAVFCSACLEDMKRHPVKPGTVIQLPQRTPRPAKKASGRKRLFSQDEQVARQRRTIRWLRVSLCCTLLLLVLSVTLLLHITRDDAPKATIGQNYIQQSDDQP